MAVVENAKPTDSPAAPAPPAGGPTPPSGLVKKLAEVMAAVGHVPKNGYNAHFKYKFVQESDLVDAIRPALAERNVMVFLDAQEERRDGDLTRIKYALRFVDGDTGEEQVTHVIADGKDSQDKGPYKAATGGLKFGLMKTFLIGTGDDPEHDRGHGAPARAKKPRDPGTSSRIATGAPPPAPQQPSKKDLENLTRIYTQAKEAGVNVRDMPNAKGVHTLAEFQESMQWLREQLKEAQGA